MFELPAAFTASDDLALRAQRLFLRSTRLQLLLLITAGAAGALSWGDADYDFAAFVAAGAFLMAAALRLSLLWRRPHRTWYQGRAAAESLKTLAWRYVSGGQPYPVDLPDAGEAFQRQVREVLHDLAAIRPKPDGIATHPTRSMSEIRRSSLERRKDVYCSGRIEDQLSWYLEKARWNSSRARLWGLCILLLQIAAATGAFLKAFPSGCTPPGHSLPS